MPQNADFFDFLSTSAKLRGLGTKTYFLKLLMCVYLRSKFQVSKIILTSFRQGEFYPKITPSAKRTLYNAHPDNFFLHKSVGWWPTSRINILTISYKLGQGCIRNWGSFVLLPIGAAYLLQNGAGVITNWGKCYCKFGQLLQNGAIITNWGITGPFIKNQNWAYFWISSPKCCKVWFYCMSKLRSTKIC